MTEFLVRKVSADNLNELHIYRKVGVTQAEDSDWQAMVTDYLRLDGVEGPIDLEEI